MKIAIASYFAPPQPAVASHRVLRLTRAILARGHRVEWVTLDPSTLPVRDETLAAVTPSEVEVHGLGGPNLVDRDARNLPEKVLRSFIFKLPDWFGAPDRHVEWSLRLRSALPRLVRERGFDVVFLCCGPHGQLIALPRLRRAFPDLKIWVDYRDLLSGNTWRQSEMPSARERLRRRERAWLSHADCLFVNTAEAHQTFLATMGDVDGLPVEVMRNAADYELARLVTDLGPSPDLGPGRHIGYFGTIFPKRRMRPLLEAMARLAPTDLAGLTLHCWTDPRASRALLEEDLAAVGGAVAERVRAHDLLGWGDALRTMQAVDALVLVNSPDQADQIFVPGKLYDYLMARRPVLFLGDRGDAWRIVAESSGDGWCHRHEELDAVAQSFRDLLAARPPDVAPSADLVPEAAFEPLLRRLT